jgi:hypothetical protein
LDELVAAVPAAKAIRKDAAKLLAVRSQDRTPNNVAQLHSLELQVYDASKALGITCIVRPSREAIEG